VFNFKNTAKLFEVSATGFNFINSPSRKNVGGMNMFVLPACSIKW
jgi:hypothetical protein